MVGSEANLAKGGGPGFHRVFLGHLWGPSPSDTEDTGEEDLDRSAGDLSLANPLALRLV